MGGWLGGHLHNTVEELKSGLPRTNPDNGREEDLKQGPLILNPALLKPLGSAASLKLNQYHQIKLFDQGCKFVLFDVESLFTNVPLQRTLKIMLDRIHNKTWSKQTSRNPRFENWFAIAILSRKRRLHATANDYEQTDVVSMGGSLDQYCVILW